MHELKSIPYNKWTLSFDNEEDENKYREHYVIEAVSRVRIGVILTIVLVWSFFLLDVYVVQYSMSVLISIRVAITLFSLCFYVITHFKVYLRYNRWIILTYVIVVVFGLIGCVLFSGGMSQTLASMTFMLVISWMFFLSGLRFNMAMGVSAASLLMLDTALVFFSVLDFDIFLMFQAYLFSNLIICGFNAYTSEQLSRNDFLSILSQKRDQVHLEKMNHQLEEEVLTRETLEGELRMSLHRATKLFEASLSLSTTRNLHDDFQAISNQMIEVIQYDSIAIMELNLDRFEIVYARGFINNEKIVGNYFELIPGTLQDKISLSPKGLIIENVKEIQSFVDLSEGQSIVSWMGMPLIYHEQVIGLMTLDSCQSGYFTKELLEVGSAFAILVAHALNKGRLEEELKDSKAIQEVHIKTLKQQNAELQFRHDLAKQMAQVKDLKFDLKEMLKLISNFFRASSVTFVMANEKKDRFFVEAEYYMNRNAMPFVGFEIPINCPIITEVFYNNQSLVVNDPSISTWFKGIEMFVLDRRAETVMVVPVRANFTQIGFLTVCSCYKSHAYKEEQVKVFRNIGLQLGEFLETYRLREKDKANMAMALRKLNQIEGIRVLLVEDNELNAQLCMEILEEEGVVVKWVKNGLEAVKQIIDSESLAYDLILMDIQMPVMDGYQATKKIREKFSQSKLPIIAMSADDIASLEDKVKRVGMNAYLTKPLEVEKLLKGLQVNGPQKPFESDMRAKENPPIDAIVRIQAFDSLYGINVEIGLHHTNHKPDLYRRILEKFYDKHHNMIAYIRMYLAENHIDELIRYVHTSKGVCATIGAQYLSSLVAMLEDQLINNREISPSILLELDNEMSRVLKGLEGVLVASHYQRLPIIEQLIDELKEERINEARKLITELREYNWEEPLQKRVVELESTIRDYEFETAIALSKKLIRDIKS